MAKRIREVRQAAILWASAFRCDVYQWLLDPRNVEVWRMFEHEANRVWRNKANKHYSARTIVEYLRHHSAANDSGAGFFELRGIVAGVAA